MSNSIDSLIAAVARIKHTCNLVVANQNNDAHMAAILADAEFNSRDITMSFLQMDAYGRQWCHARLNDMYHDSLNFDKALMRVHSIEMKAFIADSRQYMNDLALCQGAVEQVIKPEIEWNVLLQVSNKLMTITKFTASLMILFYRLIQYNEFLANPSTELNPARQ